MTLDHLARLYEADADPWGHLTRPYEQAKYANTLEAAGPGRFSATIEIGCGIGALTGRLAEVSDTVLAIDCIPAALATARAHVGSSNVTFIQAVAPGGLPGGRRDLIVLSEVLYFLSRADIDDLACWCARAASPGCRIVSVNWSGPTGQALTGGEAADHLVARLEGWSLDRRAYDGYVIDVLDRVTV